MGSDCLKLFMAPGPLPSSFVDLGKTSKSAVISPCLSDVIVNGWQGSRARLEPIPAALEKRSSLLYNTEILILPSLCATDCQKGKSRSTLHFFPLFWSVLLFSQPARHFLSCNLHYFLILIITSLFSTDVFLSSSIFFCFFLLFPSLSRAVLSAKPHPLLPVLEWPMGTWGWNSLPGKVQKPRDLTIC